MGKVETSNTPLRHGDKS